MNIVATHAYIDDHSGIVHHTCSATSMCALHTQVRVQLVWKILYMCVAMDTETHRGACGNFLSVPSS